DRGRLSTRRRNEKREAANKKGAALVGPPLTMFSSAADALMLGFDPLAVGHFTFVDSQAETALRIGANPRLENHRSAFLAIVRKWDQSAIVTLLALRQLHHTTPPVRPAITGPAQSYPTQQPNSTWPLTWQSARFCACL